MASFVTANGSPLGANGIQVGVLVDFFDISVFSIEIFSLRIDIFDFEDGLSASDANTSRVRQKS